MAAELAVAAFCLAAAVGVLAAVRAGGSWLAVALLLAVVTLVSLLPLLVGAHWATVACIRMRGTARARRA